MFSKHHFFLQGGGKAACYCCLVARSCPTLCDPVDYSPPGSSIHGILQARIPEWIAISFSRGSSWSRDQTWISCTGRRILYHWATWAAQGGWEADLSTQRMASTPLKLGKEERWFIMTLVISLTCSIAQEGRLRLLICFPQTPGHISLVACKQLLYYNASTSPLLDYELESWNIFISLVPSIVAGT